MKLFAILIAMLLGGWTIPPTEANDKSGSHFHERLPLKKKEEIRIVDDFTAEISLGSDNKWVSSNILDVLKSIPAVNPESMPREVRFRNKTIFLQQNGSYTWDAKGATPVKLTSKDIREKGNIIIQVSKETSNNLESKTSEASKNTKTNIDGFRSAKFGMTQQEVLSAIKKDFGPIAIKTGKNPIENTHHLIIQVADLLPGSGKSKVVYLFGYKSTKLNQVNLFWGTPVDPESNLSTLLLVSRNLKTYFSKKEFVKVTVRKDIPLTEESILIFQGTDTEGRMIKLTLYNYDASPDKKEKPNIYMTLSYTENPSHPDIYKIAPDDF